nr:mucin-5B-like [Dermacentor andersoni]
MDLPASQKSGRDSDDERDAPEQSMGSRDLPESKKSAPVPPCPTAEDRAAASTASATSTAVPATSTADCTLGDAVIAQTTDSLVDISAKYSTGAKAISEVPQKPPLLAALGKTPAAKVTSGKPQSAAAFLKHPPAPPTSALPRKRRARGSDGWTTPGSLQPPATATTLGPAASSQQQAPLKNTPTSPQIALSPAPESSEPAQHAFTTVLTRNAQRHATALQQAATIPVNPAVVGTALFRPSVPGGAFERGSRLAVAAVLSARPGVSAVRVNTKRNIVAADATSQACL